jgi:hypothetical protein
MAEGDGKGFDIGGDGEKDTPSSKFQQGWSIDFIRSGRQPGG